MNADALVMQIFDSSDTNFKKMIIRSKKYIRYRMSPKNWTL